MQELHEWETEAWQLCILLKTFWQLSTQLRVAQKIVRVIISK